MDDHEPPHAIGPRLDRLDRIAAAAHRLVAAWDAEAAARPNATDERREAEAELREVLDGEA